MIPKANMMQSPSELLKQSLAYLTPITTGLSVLDLACGSGRNGLYLLENGCDVVFADKNVDSLHTIEAKIANEFSENKELAAFWPVDFEHESFTGLASNQYAAIVVFRYLHRALFSQIKQAIVPGGIIVYETFTEQQPQYGRPTNPNFLLKKGELDAIFSDWTIVHSFEGIQEIPSGIQAQQTKKQAVAQIIAIKPSD